MAAFTMSGTSVKAPKPQTPDTLEFIGAKARPRQKNRRCLSLTSRHLMTVVLGLSPQLFRIAISSSADLAFLNFAED